MDSNKKKEDNRKGSKKKLWRSKKLENLNHCGQIKNIFKRWLAPHPTQSKVLCTACNKAITCCKNTFSSTFSTSPTFKAHKFLKFKYWFCRHWE